MKKKLFQILLLCIFCLISCHRRPVYPPILYVADSLTYVAPRQALQVLDSIDEEMAEADKPTRMYYQLLTIKAKDKAYITHTSDSLMLSLVDYYEHGGDKHLLPEAYYYMGSTYRDLNDAPRALEYYQKALSSMKGEENLRVKSPVYAQMGDLFRRQYLYDNALAAYQNAYRCDSMAKDSVGLVYDLRDIATMYRRKNEIDSALVYFQKARIMAESQNSIALSNLVTSQIASLQIRLGDYSAAMQSIQPSLKNVDSTNLSSIYSIVSDIYFKQERYDSATYYYKELLTHGDIYAQRRAHERLAHIANASRRTDEAHQHLLQYELLNDSIERITATESIEQMNALYNYEQQAVKNLRLEAKSRQLYYITALLFCLAIILVLSFIIYHLHVQKKRIQMEQLYHAVAQENQTFKDEEEARNRWKSEAPNLIKNSAVYKNLEELALQANNLSPEDWAAVEELLNEVYPSFIPHLRASCQMSERDFHACCLMKLKFSNTTICILTPFNSTQVLSNMCRNLYVRIHGKKGSTEDFANFIDSL